jgi:hypothetical protein
MSQLSDYRMGCSRPVNTGRGHWNRWWGGCAGREDCAAEMVCLKSAAASGHNGRPRIRDAGSYAHQPDFIPFWIDGALGPKFKNTACDASAESTATRHECTAGFPSAEPDESIGNSGVETNLDSASGTCSGYVGLGDTASSGNEFAFKAPGNTRASAQVCVSRINIVPTSHSCCSWRTLWHRIAWNLLAFVDALAAVVFIVVVLVFAVVCLATRIVESLTKSNCLTPWYYWLIVSVSSFSFSIPNIPHTRYTTLLCAKPRNAGVRWRSPLWC